LVSISKALINDRGEISGVVSVETFLEAISEVLQQTIGNYQSAYSYGTRNDRTILIHHWELLRGIPLQEVTGFPISFDKESGHFSYRLNGAAKPAYYSKIESLN